MSTSLELTLCYYAMLLQFLGDSLPFLRFIKDIAHLDVADFADFADFVDFPDFAVVYLNKVLLQQL